MLRVCRAQAGDPAAFDELFEIHHELIERLVAHFVRNRSDVEDVAQETWMRAAAHIGGLREPGRFQPWLRSIARNSCMSFLTRQQSERRVGSLDEDGAPEVPDANEVSPEEHVVSRDEQRKVWETLGMLPDRARIALFQREYQRMAYPEIARRLGLTRNAAEVCVFRAREQFRQLYRRVDEDQTTCPVTGLQLAMYMEHELDELSRRRVMKHVRRCGACERRLEAIRTGHRLYDRPADAAPGRPKPEQAGA